MLKVQNEFRQRRITFLHGDAISEAVASRVIRLAAGKRRMGIDDGSHTYHDVLGAARLYAPCVSPGSYYVIEDAFTNRLIYGAEPDAMSAVDQFLAENEQFERDPSFDCFVFFSAFQAILRRRGDGV